MVRHFYVLGLLGIAPHPLVGQRGGAAAPVVVAYSEWAITAPASLPSGYTLFRAVNRGKELHHATLLRIENGHTFSELLEALKKGPPVWVTVMGGLQNDGEVGIELTPGNYAWLCLLPAEDGTSQLSKGMSLGFTVTKTTNGVHPPTPDITVTMKDYTWVVSKPLSAGKHVVKLLNAPGQAHEFMLVRLAAGKNTNDLTEWMGSRKGPRPFITIEGVPTLSTSAANFVMLDLVPGRYSVISFNPDIHDGRNQFVHGMVRELVIR